MDSGASRHTTPCRSLLHNLQNRFVLVTNLHFPFTLKAPTHCAKQQRGEAFLLGPLHPLSWIPHALHSRSVSRSLFLYIPSLGFHMLSIHQVCKSSMQVEFEENSIIIRDKTITQVVWCNYHNGIYKHTTFSSLIGFLWHSKFRHLHVKALWCAFQEQMVIGLQIPTREGIYPSCVLEKQHQESFSRQASQRAIVPLVVVYADSFIRRFSETSPSKSSRRHTLVGYQVSV